MFNNKALSYEHKLMLLKFTNDWLSDPNLTYLAWKSANMKVLPKKGDLSDPNNW